MLGCFFGSTWLHWHHPPPLAYSFSHLPSHLCISNDIVSPHLPTCPPIYLPSGTHISAYLPIYPYTPINVLDITQAWGNVDESRCKTCNPCGVVKMMKSNENIAFHHVNNCVVLPLLYLLATQVSTYWTPHKHTYLPGSSTLTPHLSIVMFKWKKCRYCISFGFVHTSHL
jgi:hypothetical protein